MKKETLEIIIIMTMHVVCTLRVAATNRILLVTKIIVELLTLSLLVYMTPSSLDDCETMV